MKKSIGFVGVGALLSLAAASFLAGQAPVKKSGDAARPSNWMTPRARTKTRPPSGRPV